MLIRSLLNNLQTASELELPCIRNIEHASPYHVVVEARFVVEHVANILANCIHVYVNIIDTVNVVSSDNVADIIRNTSDA